MMDYRRFGIGTTVGASSTMNVTYGTGNNKKICKALGPVTGMIIGLKRFMLGTYEPGEHGDQAYLTVSGSIVVWVIKTGLLNTPVYALDEDVVEACIPLHYRLPVLHQNQPE
ncbi:hypothetical protein LCGC14_2673250, partial [marine sediment metagenome]